MTPDTTTTEDPNLVRQLQASLDHWSETRSRGRGALRLARTALGDAISDAMAGRPDEQEIDMLLAEMAAIRAAVDAAAEMLVRKRYLLAQELPWARRTLAEELERVASLPDAPTVSLEDVVGELSGDTAEAEATAIEEDFALLDRAAKKNGRGV